MNLFLDTSSLVKLYCVEKDSFEVESLISQYEIEHIFLSELAQIEFPSAIWKKIRSKELDEEIGKSDIKVFESDHGKYAWITVDGSLIEMSKKLIAQYGKNGLRTLDALQLASAVSVRKEAELYHTSDILLKKLFEEEGLIKNK
jgi:predicted nucleic acid-binding protein